MRRSTLRAAGLACALGIATTWAGCGPEGVGTIGADRPAVSSVMLLPERDASIPTPTKGRVRPPAARAKAIRR